MSQSVKFLSNNPFGDMSGVVVEGAWDDFALQGYPTNALSRSDEK